MTTSSMPPAYTTNEPVPDGAPDWNALLQDEAAINRMAQYLCDQISAEAGGIPLGGLWEARAVVREMIESAHDAALCSD